MHQRPLSNSPEAVRQRRHREKKAEAAKAPATPAENDNAPSSQTASSAPLHETSQVTGDKAAWVTTPTVTVAEGETEAKPIAEAAAEPERETTPEEAAVIAKLVGMYVGAGWSVLANRHRTELEQFVASMPLPPALEALPPDQRLSVALGAMVGMVEKSTSALCVKYSVRFPYQDEAIVAVALGTATFGLFGKRPQPTEQQRAHAAKDANPRNDNTSERAARADGRGPSGGFDL